jgi:hypothetical protein
MKSRPGVTLVEVLVSIFTMGIGLLSLLTLFPLGASNMAQALRDQRLAHAAANASAQAEAFNIRNDKTTLAALIDPNPTGTHNPPLPSLDVPGYDGPSYAVLTDPVGVYSSLSPFSEWVAGLNSTTGGIPRRKPSNFFFNTTSLFFFTLLDDMQFNPNGTPDISSGQLERTSGFSWAYLQRRPRNRVPGMVDLSIVIYSQRPLRLTTGLNPNEQAYTASFDTTRNVVTLTWGPGQPPPAIRSGGWILDATVERFADSNFPSPGRPHPHGFFYRVNEVTDLGGNTLELSCDTTFKEFARNQVTPGVVILIEGVAEVVEKGPGWLPGDFFGD